MASLISSVVRASALAFAAVVGLAACSTQTTTSKPSGATSSGTPAGGTTDGTAPATIEAACERQANAICAAQDRCGLLRRIHGALSCPEVLARGCLLDARAGSVAPADIDACAEAAVDTTCEPYFKLPASCTYKGALGASASCAYNSECASGWCSVPNGKACGTCIAYSKLGAACTGYNTCEGDAYCRNDVCVAYKKLGEACDNQTTTHCVPGLYCDGTCRKRLAIGASCKPTDVCVDGVCDDKTKTCVALPLVDLGEACGATGICAGQARCVNGRCVAAPVEGESCTNEKPCQWPFRCVDSKCGAVEPSACR